MGHLHGVSTAQAGRVRTHVAIEPFKFLALTTRTVNFAEQRGNSNALLDVVPNVEIQEVTIDLVESAGQDFERLRSLITGDDVDDWPQDPSCFTGASFPRRRRPFENAAQATGLSRRNRHSLDVPC